MGPTVQEAVAGPLGLGCMRLSDVDEARALGVLHAALEQGVALLDTADAYHGPPAQGGRPHDNERLIARALAGSAGPSRPRVATKVGLVRAGLRWREEGTRRHILSAAEESRAALGVERLDLLQLHALDPRTPLGTSLRALQHAKEQGLATRIGVCNVNATELAAALEEADLDAVQVEVNLWNLDAIRGGVLEVARAAGLEVLVARPLGGVAGARRLMKDRTLKKRTERPGAAALGFLRRQLPGAVLLPGPTSVVHLQELWTPGHRADEQAADELLEQRHPGLGLVRRPLAARRPASFREGDVVVVLGAPGAGKSSRAAEYERRGYLRLNRDRQGGRLDDLLPPLDAALAGPGPRVVLDNTYSSRAQRQPIVELAFRHGVAPRVEWVATDVDVCLAGVARRLIEQTGYLPGPDELRALRKENPQAFGPQVVREHFRRFEPPLVDEGFTRVDVIARTEPARRGPLVWVLDGQGTSPAGEGVAEALAPSRAEGGLVVVTLFLPGASAAAVERAQAPWRAALGEPLAFAVCTHAPAARCWCLKPLPGGVLEVLRQQGALSRPGVVVGPGSADRTLARRLGFEHRPGLA